MGRPSLLEVFCKRETLKGFAKFTRNSCDGVSFFNKVTDIRLAFIKKRLLAFIKPY